MHFASAYTLINHAAGTSARYASGYVVLPGDFQENPDGTYTAAVPQYRGHAWVEGYHPKLGWFPVEVTPPSYLGGLQEAGPLASPEEVLDQGLQGETPGAEEEPKEEEEAEKQDASQESLVWQSLTLVLAVFLCLACLALLNVLRIRLIWKRRAAALGASDTSRAALYAGRLIFGLLRAFGIRMESRETEPEFALRAEEGAPWIEPGAFREGMELLLAARYGRQPIEEEQRDRVASLYWRMMAEAGRQMNKKQRFWYQYFHVKVKK